MLRSGHPGLRYQGCSGLAPENAERRKSFCCFLGGQRYRQDTDGVKKELLRRKRGMDLSFMRLSAVSAACCTRLSTLCRPLCCNSSLCCSLSCSETEYPSRPSVRTCITHAHHASKLSLRCVVQWLLMHVQLGLTNQLCFTND